ncbi:MAG: FAD-binding oxidoreductase [Sneathiella sp.]|nr:FAD-binding oxidoreductase [Sneathiella sp.]
MSKCSVKSALVVGAGIVGVSTAYALQKEGVKVTLVDRKGPCAGTSYGNAGAIVDGSSVPNAMPGLWKSVPSMLADPTGPLTIRWSYMYKIAPWLLRFVNESRPHRAEANAAALRALTKNVASDWLALTKETALDDLVTDVGWLKVFDSDAGFEGTKSSRDMMIRHNTEFEVLGMRELRDLEPNLSTIFRHGIFQKRSRFLLNPERMVVGIADAFKDIGGDIVISDIHSLQSDDKGVTAIGSGGVLQADTLVLCTGAWSKNLAGQFGAKIPLDTERGYHLMFPVIEDKPIQRPILYGEKSFVLAPLETGVRMTSQVEFAGLENGPDFRRVRKLIPYAKKMLPSLVTEEKDVWLGYRPSLPDSLPVIGPSPKDPKVVFAFGHQHYGMSLGPTTAKLVRNIILGQPQAIPLWPYRANRFF